MRLLFNPRPYASSCCRTSFLGKRLLHFFLQVLESAVASISNHAGLLSISESVPSSICIARQSHIEASSGLLLGIMTFAHTEALLCSRWFLDHQLFGLFLRQSCRRSPKYIFWPASFQQAIVGIASALLAQRNSRGVYLAPLQTVVTASESR